MHGSWPSMLRAREGSALPSTHRSLRSVEHWGWQSMAWHDRQAAGSHVANAGLMVSPTGSLVELDVPCGILAGEYSWRQDRRSLR